MPALVADREATKGLTGSVDGSKGQNDDAGNRSHIAICGVGIRLPEGIRNTEAFWNSMIIDLGSRTFDQESQHKGQPTAGHVTRERFLSEDLRSSDAAFFSTAKDTSIECDPYHHKLLEITHECLEDACETNYRGSIAAVACYVAMPPHNDATNGANNLSTSKRISQQYDFQGPR